MDRNINMISVLNEIELQVIHTLGSDNKIAKISREKLQALIKNPLWFTIPDNTLYLDWSI